MALRRPMTAIAAVATLLLGGFGLAPGSTAPAGAAPSAADRCYTAALHEVFLGRTADVYDIEAWTDRHLPAPARPALPRAMAGSGEWLTSVVVGVYAAALDRPPDLDGLVFWTERLRGGTRVATLTATIYGSDEVWQRAGATAAGYVSDVFPRILGRPPTSGDVAYWAGQVAARGRGGVARALLGSGESRRARVTDLYLEILGRAPDAAGRDFWAGRLTSLDDVQLAVHLASSPEAYQRAQAGCSVPPEPTTGDFTASEGADAGQRSARISADGRWIAFTSDATELVPGDVQDTIVDLFLLDRTTGTVTKVTDGDRRVRDVAMSADGRHIAFSATVIGLPQTRNLDVFTWDRETAELRDIGIDRRDESQPSISADGSSVAYSSRAPDLVGADDGRPDVFLWDRATGIPQQVSTTVVENGAGAPRLASDASRIAYLVDDGRVNEVVVWERDTGTTTPVAEISSNDGRVLPLDVADDGEVLYTRYTAGDGALRLWDPATGRAATIVDRDTVREADLAADGQTVAFAWFADGVVPEDVDNTADVFVWVRATGTVAHIGVTGRTGADPTTSADGRFVAYHSTGRSPGADPQITVWDRES